MEFMWLTLKNSVLTSQRTNWDYITNTNKINSFYNTCLSSKWSTHSSKTLHPLSGPWSSSENAFILLCLLVVYPILVFLGSPMCPSERLALILFLLENYSKSIVNTICAQNPESSVLNQVVHTLTTFISSIPCIWRASFENAVVRMHTVCTCLLEGAVAVPLHSSCSAACEVAIDLAQDLQALGKVVQVTWLP
jgi:hypothetical protein